jgi:xanthocillin biosynthesis cytochrome P450 monooxygenase
VTRPDLLTDMFRNEDLYAKAGSQKKIPWSVIASLVGDNIINSHGDTWKLYTGIMKPGMQRRNWDTTKMVHKSRTFVSLLLDQQRHNKQNTGVLCNPLIQRLAISIMGDSFLDTDFGVGAESHPRDLLPFSRPPSTPLPFQHMGSSEFDV